MKNLIIKCIALLTLVVSVLLPTVASAGYASWYGPGFHGRKTANGERYNMYALTAAHKRLPFGTKVRVTNLKNNKSVIVRINDRGPFVGGRVIDLSKSANQAIGCNLCKVKLDVVYYPKKSESKYRRGTKV